MLKVYGKLSSSKMMGDQGWCMDDIAENGKVWKNAECKLCHQNVDKGEEVQWQGESMDLSLSFKEFVARKEVLR